MSFLLDFEDFLSQSTNQELNKRLFENKYYFVDNPKDEIINGVDYTSEQVLSKNKNLPEFNQGNISSKFKKMLSHLGVNSRLIDEQMSACVKEMAASNESTILIRFYVVEYMTKQHQIYQKKK